MRRTTIVPLILVMAFAVVATRGSPAQGPEGMQTADPPRETLPPPQFAESCDLAGLGPALPEETCRPLPINLATALRLGDARPLVIEAARAALETEAGLYEQARVLWLPTVYLGASYQRHDGGQQEQGSGQLITGARDQFQAGVGAQAKFALTDAIYTPLAERRLLQSRTTDIQTAKNDALLAVAEAYFDVQRARGILAGAQDSVLKARNLTRRIGALGIGLTPPVEVERARTLLADLEQQAASARQDWRTSSANLTRVLRIDPAAVVVPLEGPHLRVTLIAPAECLDALIPIGLTSRPELASQQAIVQATLIRLKQERMRPLIPSLILQSSSNATPDETIGGGVFGAGSNTLNQWSGRSDWNAQMVWQIRNLGFGNQGLVRQRRGEQRLALVELFRLQDQIASEVTQAHAQVEAAAVRVQQAEPGLKAALLSYAGNIRGLSETVRAGNLLQLVVRPQEAVAALQQLQQAYINYYTSTSDYNRAQFRLFRALGYPSQQLACSDTLGPVLPVDTLRPPQLAPVHAPEPCDGCRP